MAENAGEASGDPDQFSLHDGGACGKGDSKRNSDRRKAFQRVEAEYKVPPLLP